jgi:predicted hydrocarbon binding protein
MTSLRERLTWDPTQGAWHDGPRRYLMMRPDVLMGAIAGLPEAMRGQALQAWAEAARERGADSLRAYARDVKGDGAALIAATVGAAADLGWGRWKVRQEAARLLLEVDSSPFATGWPAHVSATGPVCAPVQGLFSALSTLVLGGTPIVEETRCLACGGSSCRFIARRAR